MITGGDWRLCAIGLVKSAASNSSHGGRHHRRPSAAQAALLGAIRAPPPASGILSATYDTASKKLAWTGTIAGLSGPLAAAHFHGPAEPGQNAGVLIPAPGVSSGAFEGAAVLHEPQARALIAGQTYFNVHTAAHPNGELRGQVVKAE